MTTSINVHSCAISLPVNGRTPKHKAEVILHDMAWVSVERNPILKEIVKWFDIWDTNPIFYVNNIPYRMELIYKSDAYAELYQMGIKWVNDNNGYEVINKRRVIITYMVKNDNHHSYKSLPQPMACM